MGQLEEKEENLRQASCRDQREADADLARRLSEKWDKIDSRAAHRLEKEKQRLAMKDERLAKKMQRSAINDMERDKGIHDMEQCWTAPRLLVSDNEGGICIQARLPNLFSAEVTLQTKPASVVVRAQPERAAFFKNAQELGAKFHIPEAIRFSVELNIVGGGVEDGWKDTLSVSHTLSHLKAY